MRVTTRSTGSLARKLKQTMTQGQTNDIRFVFQVTNIHLKDKLMHFSYIC